MTLLRPRSPYSVLSDLHEARRQLASVQSRVDEIEDDVADLEREMRRAVSYWGDEDDIIDWEDFDVSEFEAIHTVELAKYARLTGHAYQGQVRLCLVNLCPQSDRAESRAGSSLHNELEMFVRESRKYRIVTGRPYTGVMRSCDTRGVAHAQG